MKIEQSNKHEKIPQRQGTAATDVFISPSYLQTQILPKDQSFYAKESENFENFARKCIASTEMILGSSDGGLYKVQLLDSRVAATLLSLQNQIHQDYAKFSKVSIKGETGQSALMLNLDLIKQFLSFPDQT